MVTDQTYMKRKFSVIALSCVLLVSTAAMAAEGENEAAYGAWSFLEDGKTMARYAWAFIRMGTQDKAFFRMTGGIAVTKTKNCELDTSSFGKNNNVRNIKFKDTFVYSANTSLIGAAAYSMTDTAIDTLEKVFDDWRNGELKSPKAYVKDWARGSAIEFVGFNIVTLLQKGGLSIPSHAACITIVKQEFAKTQAKSAERAKKLAQTRGGSTAVVGAA